MVEYKFFDPEEHSDAADLNDKLEIRFGSHSIVLSVGDGLNMRIVEEHSDNLSTIFLMDLTDARSIRDYLNQWISFTDGAKVFSCDKCKAEFEISNELLRSVRIGPNDTQIYYCDKCMADATVKDWKQLHQENAVIDEVLHGDSQANADYYAGLTDKGKNDKETD